MHSIGLSAQREVCSVRPPPRQATMRAAAARHDQNNHTDQNVLLSQMSSGKMPHFEFAILDHIQLGSSKANISLLDQDIASIDLAFVHIRHDLALHVRLQLVEQKHLPEAFLHAHPHPLL